MPTASKPALGPAKRAKHAPLIGALLRMTYQITRKRQFEALVSRGFTDLNQALLSVLVYPYPDGIRPGDLAERANMTKQAMNYLLGQLEELGYVERRAEEGSARRCVFLTLRGWQVVDTQLAAVREVEAEWKDQLGAKRFEAFVETLRDLALGEPNATHLLSTAQRDSAKTRA